MKSRADASPELRERAIYWIAHRSGPEATDALARLYDEQKKKRSKKRILYWLGHRGGKAGLQKTVYGRQERSISESQREGRLLSRSEQRPRSDQADRTDTEVIQEAVAQTAQFERCE